MGWFNTLVNMDTNGRLSDLKYQQKKTNRLIAEQNKLLAKPKEQQMAEIQEAKAKAKQEKINLKMKKLELAQKKQEIEDAKTPEQKAREKEKNMAKAQLAGSLALGPFGLISKRNRENIKKSVDKLLEK